MARPSPSHAAQQAGSGAACFPRMAGVLLPLASLPGPHGVGDLGPEALRFVRWCGRAGLGWWQLLPTTPLGPGDSPYSSSSAFATEPLYLSIDGLVRAGLLPAVDRQGPATLRGGRAQFGAARAFKRPRFQRAFERWLTRGGPGEPAFSRFCARESDWLGEWESFRGGPPGYEAFLQFQLDCQWRALRAEAADVDLRLMGDAPLFVGLQSADVAAHPELFRLDERGRPTVVSGCPPDAFCPDGQRWGHPHYAWPAHRADGFRWWRARIERLLRGFDAVRIDHFIGFHHAWEVGARARTARRGRWGPAPGEALLTALHAGRDRLPLIVEDLGATDPGVLELRDAFELPGMRVLHFGFGRDSEHAPHRIPLNSVVYPGTHDNDTTVGWWRGLDSGTRRRVLANTGGSARTIAWDLVRTACTSPAHTALFQVQDLLGLDGRARTNVPGTPEGNWRWRLAPTALTAPLARRVRALVEATDRLPGTPEGVQA